MMCAKLTSWLIGEETRAKLAKMCLMDQLESLNVFLESFVFLKPCKVF